MRTINKIIIHCSDSEWGNAIVIDRWHRERGFDEIGYHYVILNDKTNWEETTSWTDGLIETGRPSHKIGAHCYGKNKDSIGICLIGKYHFTTKQWASLDRLLEYLKEEFNLTDDDVYGHRDFDSGKTCPNFDIKEWLIGGK